MSKISLTGHFVCGLNDRTGEIDVKTRNVTRFDSFNHDYLFVVFATDFARQVLIAKLYIPEIQLAPFSEVEKSVICIAMSDLKQSIWSTNAEAFYFRMFSWSSVNIDARCVDGKSSMNVMFVDQFSCQNSGSSSIFTQEHLEIQRGENSRFELGHILLFILWISLYDCFILTSCYQIERLSCTQIKEYTFYCCQFTRWFVN